MGEVVSVRLDAREIDGIESVKTDEDKNDAEALRDVIKAGLASKGYLNGVNGYTNGDDQTMLRATAQRFTDAFALFGLFLLGATFWLPIEFRAFVAAPFAMAMATYALDRVLADHEPAVSNRLASVIERRKA